MYDRDSRKAEETASREYCGLDRETDNTTTTVSILKEIRIRLASRRQRFGKYFARWCQ